MDMGEEAMHALETLIQRNTEAAAREAAHAKHDGDEARYERIVAAAMQEPGTYGIFQAAYARALREG